MMKAEIEDWLNNLTNPGTPDEYEVKVLLKKFGIAVPTGIRFGPGEKVSTTKLDNPLVLKVCSGDLLHKTDLGGVMLNLENNSLAIAADEMRKKLPQTALLVEEQIKPDSIEFIVGALVDPDFGPAVMVGTGGIFTELYKDVTFRLIPCSRHDVRRMLQELTAFPVFTGFRSSEANLESLVELVLSVSDLVVSLGNHFDQLDINPVVYAQGRWVALDANLMLSNRNNTE